MKHATLLIELGTEELPPKSLKTLSEAFTREFIASLQEAQVITADNNVKAYAAPRRLAIQIEQVASAQPDQKIERRGPAVQAAFKDGAPTPAAIGFAKSCGVEVSDLSRLSTDKGEWLSYEVTEIGAKIDELVQTALDLAIKKLPIPKRMRWGNSDAEFVRPAKWLTVLFDDQVLNVECLQLQADRTSRGHRFHSTGLIEHKHANDYAKNLLEKGHVMAHFESRQALIKEQIGELAASVNGFLSEDQALLDEVTGLVEHPRAVLGTFDKSFLDVPAECLISSMRDHQKYFHLKDNKHNLLPFFITVSNIESKNEARMIQGNERVLRARLSDAEFFWKSDQKIKLEDRVERLGSVLFHAKLGTLLQKSHRVQTLAKLLADELDADTAIAQRAALLCKADLVSDMVGEFDELQGIMGHYYADRDGEDPSVGEAIEQHYRPKFAGDSIPQSAEAQAVALADKLDSLVGIYASGEIPTGDKDPYALRRSSLSILRILIEHKHPLTVASLVQKAAQTYQTVQSLEINEAVQHDIVAFVLGRIPAYYQAQGIAVTQINSVAACDPASPLDFEYRLKAVAKFAQLDEAEDLAAANKRISNILKKLEKEVSATVDPTLLNESAEEELYKAIESIAAQCTELFAAGNYDAGLQLLASLRAPVDGFFDNVMVMAEQPELQANRLALLKQIQDLFLQVADISLIQT